jgi:hypothetical protein
MNIQIDLDGSKCLRGEILITCSTNISYRYMHVFIARVRVRTVDAFVLKYGVTNSLAVLVAKSTG